MQTFSDELTTYKIINFYNLSAIYIGYWNNHTELKKEGPNQNL